MDAKEWLGRARRIDAEINALIEEQKRAWDRAVSLTTGMTDDKVQTSRSNTSEDKFIRYADYAREIDRRIDQLYTVKQEIMSVINKLEDGTLRALLIEYYVNGKTWEQVADGLHYSRMQVFRLHNKALDGIECYIGHVV